MSLIGPVFSACKMRTHITSYDTYAPKQTSGKTPMYHPGSELLIFPINELLSASAGLHAYPPNTRAWQSCVLSMLGKVVLKEIGTRWAGGAWKGFPTAAYSVLFLQIVFRRFPFPLVKWPFELHSFSSVNSHFGSSAFLGLDICSSDMIVFLFSCTG